MKLSLYQKAISLLESDILKNLVTLKYLTLYKKDTAVSLIEDGTGWAVASTFPTAILSFDREAYPRAKTAIFVNGTSKELKYQLLYELPVSNCVLRLNEPLDLSPVEKCYRVTRGYTYNSYTCSTLPASTFDVTSANSVLTPEAVKLFGLNGHDEADLNEYFKNGAKWFGVKVDNALKSACFIFRDYGSTMEIGGVRTLDNERQKGYARAVVYSAIRYLLDNNLMPRYCTEENNINSIRLAESLGMKRFLRIEHYLVEPK